MTTLWMGLYWYKNIKNVIIDKVCGYITCKEITVDAYFKSFSTVSKLCSYAFASVNVEIFYLQFGNPRPLNTSESSYFIFTWSNSDYVGSCFGKDYLKSYYDEVINPRRGQPHQTKTMLSSRTRKTLTAPLI